MKTKKLLFIALCLLAFEGGAATGQQEESPTTTQTTVPIYKDAAYGGQTVRVENASIRLEVHKRITGWGWVEIFTPAGELVAVLEHLGEVAPLGFSGIEFPLRLEATEYQREQGEFGQRWYFLCGWVGRKCSPRLASTTLSSPSRLWKAPSF